MTDMTEKNNFENYKSLNFTIIVKVTHSATETCSAT